MEGRLSAVGEGGNGDRLAQHHNHYTTWLFSTVILCIFKGKTCCEIVAEVCDVRGRKCCHIRGHRFTSMNVNGVVWIEVLKETGRVYLLIRFARLNLQISRRYLLRVSRLLSSPDKNTLIIWNVVVEVHPLPSLNLRLSSSKVTNTHRLRNTNNWVSLETQNCSFSTFHIFLFFSIKLI